MASPATSAPARLFTFEDLEQMPDDGYRREIIGGSLVVSPAPNAFHQRAVGRLHTLLNSAPPAGVEALVAPFDWRPVGGDVYEPDVLVIRTGDVDQRGFLRPGAIPLLAVEVLSSNRIADLVTKRAVYEAAGLLSYWVVDPVAGSILALGRGPAGVFVIEAEVAGDEVFATDKPFPLRFSPGALGGA